jgi:hypothetical protein
MIRDPDSEALGEPRVDWMLEAIVPEPFTLQPVQAELIEDERKNTRSAGKNVFMTLLKCKLSARKYEDFQAYQAVFRRCALAERSCTCIHFRRFEPKAGDCEKLHNRTMRD